MAQHIDEEALIAEKKKQSNYIPLADYFMLWLLTWGRELTEIHSSTQSTTLEDSDIWSWRFHLMPWGYIEELDIDDITTIRLTDKAMALLNERANNVS
jgi:hypothetical protein